MDLKIEPKFRDLIPPLTDDEARLLEENILADGEIYYPIITWNGVIVDGHHRWEIIQRHPEIPYKVKEMDFANEYAAMAWACNNQLGQRNLTDEQKTYLIGKRLENEKMAYGARDGFRGNQYSKSDEVVSYQNGILPKPEPPKGRTAERLAKEYGVGQGTVNRAEKFAKGVDIAEELSPGIKENILAGRINVPKSVLQDMPKATPEQQKEIVESIKEGKPKKVKPKPEPIPEPEPEPYNADNLLGDIRANWQNCKRGLTMIIMDDHCDLLETAEGRANAETGLKEAISDLQEMLSKI